MKFISRLFTFFFALLILILSVLNREQIDLVWSIQGDTISLPLYWVLFIGIFLGLFAAIWGTGWTRLKDITSRRQTDRRVIELEDEVAALEQERRLDQTPKVTTD